MNIPGVPDSVTREDFLKLLRVMGFDPARVVTLSIGLRSVDVEVYVLNAEGNVFVDDHERLLTHNLAIPIV